MAVSLVQAVSYDFFYNLDPHVFTIEGPIAESDLLVVLTSRAGGTGTPVVSGMGSWNTIPNKPWTGMEFDAEVDNASQVAPILNFANAHVFTMTGASGAGSITVTANYSGVAILYVIRGLSQPVLDRVSWIRYPQMSNTAWPDPTPTVSVENVGAGSFVILMARRYKSTVDTETIATLPTDPVPSDGWVVDRAVGEPGSVFGGSMGLDASHLIVDERLPLVSASISGYPPMNDFVMQMLVFGQESDDARESSAYAEAAIVDSGDSTREVSGGYAEAVVLDSGSSTREISGAYVEAVDWSPYGTRAIDGGYAEILDGTSDSLRALQAAYLEAITDLSFHPSPGTGGPFRGWGTPLP